MASKKGSIPGPDPGFHGFIGPFSDYVSANAAALKADPDDVTALTTAVTTWKTAYPAHTAAHSAATGARNVKDQSRADVEAVARPLIQQFQASTTVTDAQRSAMNINIHATTRTPAAVPTTRPIVTVGTSQRLQHVITYRDEASVGRGRPAGVQSCEIWSKVGGPAPTDFSQMAFVDNSTKSPYKVQYNGAQAGQTVYFWLRWVNTRGEKGPWSEPVSATIAG